MEKQDDTEMMEVLLGVRGVHVIGAKNEPGGFRALIETRAETGTCPTCGADAVEDGRVVREHVDPEEHFGRRVVFEWHVRRWRCSVACGQEPWEESLPAVGSAQRGQRR